MTTPEGSGWPESDAEPAGRIDPGAQALQNMLPTLGGEYAVPGAGGSGAGRQEPVFPHKNPHSIDPGMVLVHMLDRSPLDRQTAAALYEQVRSGEPIANGDVVDDTCRLLADTGLLDPHECVMQFSRSSEQLARLMAADTGVWEGYTLHEHTQAVLGRFDDEFGRRVSAEERQTVRVALLLQDIAKPVAVGLDGSPKNQQQYNQPFASAVLSVATVLSADQKNTAELLMAHDFIGKAVRGFITPEEAREGLLGIRGQCPEPYRNRFLTLARMVYFSDASAYTRMGRYKSADGYSQWCVTALDHIFARDEMGDIRFASEQQQTILDYITSPL